MKKTLIALAAIAATSAFAQSTVTINGSILYGVNHNVLGGNSYGAIKGDRNFIQFSGVEDMGNGNNATFTLNQRFRSENGNAGTYNATNATAATTEKTLMEQAAIGLNSKQFGNLRLGRFTNIVGFNAYNFQEDSPFGAGTSSQYGRLSAQIQYITPEFNGFSGAYTYASKSQNTSSGAAGNGFGQGTVIGTTDDFGAVTLKYAKGPVFAQFSTVSGLMGEKSYHIGGTYDLGGGIKLALGQFSQSDALVQANSAGQLSFKNNMVGAEYTTGAWVTALTYSKASDNIANAFGSTKAVGAVAKVGAKAYYSLSKRTSIDFETSNVSSSNVDTDGTAYYLGLRHTF